ncbi:MAG: hypothetical protein QXF01_02860 [Candidatus Micrarchaeaceae archaeon]
MLWFAGILLSIGSIDSLIPLMLIVILIVAAAGSTRGYSIFNIFGIAALTGIGAGRGSIQGRSAFGRFMLMSQRPKDLGINPKKNLKRRIKARVMNRRQLKGDLKRYHEQFGLPTPPTSKFAKVRSRISIGTGRVKMAVSGAKEKVIGKKPVKADGKLVGYEYSRRYRAAQRVGYSVIGRPGTTKREFSKMIGRLLLRSSPLVGATLALRKKYKKLMSERKSLSGYLNNEIARLESELRKQEYYKKVISARARGEPWRLAFRDQNADELLGRAEARWQSALSKYKEGKLTAEELGKEVKSYNSQISKLEGIKTNADQYGRNVPEGIKVEVGIDGTSRVTGLSNYTRRHYENALKRGMEGVLGRTFKPYSGPNSDINPKEAMLKAQLAYATNVRNMLDTHVEKIYRAKEKLGEIKSSQKAGEMSKSEYREAKRDLKSVTKSERQAYLKIMKGWSKENTSITGMKHYPGSTQITMVRKVIGTGRGVVKSIKNHNAMPTVDERNMIILNPMDEGNLNVGVHRAILAAAGLDAQSKKAAGIRKKRLEQNQDSEA